MHRTVAIVRKQTRKKQFVVAMAVKIGVLYDPRPFNRVRWTLAYAKPIHTTKCSRPSVAFENDRNTIVWHGFLFQTPYFWDPEICIKIISVFSILLLLLSLSSSSSSSSLGDC